MAPPVVGHHPRAAVEGDLRWSGRAGSTRCGHGCGRSLAAHVRHDEHLAEDEETLDYEVPEGQDPAVVVAALNVNGLDAAASNTGGHQLVHIAGSPDDPGVREQAREVIAGIGTTSLDAGVPIDARPIRFTDER